jgi:hypothetical protein
MLVARATRDWICLDVHLGEFIRQMTPAHVFPALFFHHTAHRGSDDDFQMGSGIVVPSWVQGVGS